MSIQNSRPTGRTLGDLAPSVYLGDITQVLVPPRVSSIARTSPILLAYPKQIPESSTQDNGLITLPKYSTQHGNQKFSGKDTTPLRQVSIRDTRKSLDMRRATAAEVQEPGHVDTASSQKSLRASTTSGSNPNNIQPDVGQLTALKLKEVIPCSSEIPEDPRKVFRGLPQTESRRSDAPSPKQPETYHDSRKQRSTSPTSSLRETGSRIDHDSYLWPAPLRITKQQKQPSPNHPDKPDGSNSRRRISLHEAFSRDTLFEALCEQVSHACSDNRPILAVSQSARCQPHRSLVGHEPTGSLELETTTDSFNSIQGKMNGKPNSQLCQVEADEEGKMKQKRTAPVAATCKEASDAKFEFVPFPEVERLEESKEGQLAPAIVLGHDRKGQEDRVEVFVHKTKPLPGNPVRKLSRKPGRIFKE